MQYLRFIWRWLLELDTPVPDWDEAGRLAYQREHLKFNFAVNALEGAAFWFGMSFASTATIVPLFIRKCTDSSLALAAVAAIAGSGWALPQLLTANWVERLVHKKAIVVRLGFLSERLPTLLFPLAALLAFRWPGPAVVVYLVGLAWHTFGAGVIATAWQDMIANCFPVQLRGRLFGTMAFVGSGAALLGASFSAWVLRSFPFPTSFVITFSIGAFGIITSFVVLALTREPVTPVVKEHQSHREFFRTLPDVVRSDENLRALLLARTFMILGGMGFGFVTTSAFDRWQVPDAMAAWYQSALMAGQITGNLVFGLLSDRCGHKLTLQLGSSCAAVGYAVAAIAPGPRWYYLSFALFGVAGAAFFVSGILLVMELAVPERRPTYTGLVNTVVGLLALVGPLVGRQVLHAGYGMLFGLGAVLQTVGVVLLTLRVREPRHLRAVEVAEGGGYNGPQG